MSFVILISYSYQPVMKNIFPKEFIAQSVEFHRHKFLRKSHTLYIVLLIGLIIVALLLPIIRIDLYSDTPGMIRPKKARNLINSPINGKVERVNITENSFVNEGDTLIMLNDRDISLTIKRLKNHIDSLKFEAHDLRYLIRTNHFNGDSILTSVHKSQLQEHRYKTKSFNDNLSWNLKDLERQKQLFKHGVIARKEYEKSEESWESAKNDLQSFKSQQKRIWQKELQVKLSELRVLYRNLLEFEKNKHN